MEHGDGDEQEDREMVELARRIRRSNVVTFVTVMKHLRQIAEAEELIDRALPPVRRLQSLD